MKTVEDLGKKVKAKYPGIYDHLSDEEVGRAVKAKYPNEYSHYEDTILDIPQTKISNGTNDTAHLNRLLSELDKLASLYNADRGRITSWWQRGKAESRGKLLFALNEEMRLIIEVISLRSQAHSAEWRHKAALEIEQLLHRNQKAILEIATAQGMDVGIYQQKLLMQLEIDKEILLERERLENRLEEARVLSDLRIQEQERIKIVEARIEAALALQSKIYDAAQRYYQLKEAGASKKEIAAAKEYLDDLEGRKGRRWESISNG